MESMLFFPIFSSFIFFCSIKFSMAVDTLSPGRFIRDGEKLVSPSRNFELGYFSPGKSKNRYLGIWYKKIPETIVWVANGNSPIADPHGALTISKTGNLVLLNETNGIIWSSNISQKIESPVAQLLDTGNFVLMDNFRGTTSESYHWQSFDHPSDTLLAGMKLGWNIKTGLQRHLTSWRSADDPSPGNYTFRYDNLVLPQMCLYQGSVKIFCGGVWNGGSYGANLPTNFLYERSLVHNEGEFYYKFESYNNPVIMIMKLNPKGKVQRLIWKERTMRWEIIYSLPGNFCENYGKCGANSVCSVDKTPNCECLEGFKLKSQNNQTWPVTCVRSHSSDCRRRDRFLKLADIKLPDLLAVSLNESMNLKECEAECLKNCSCRAYANFNVTVGARGCLMWYGDLIDIRKIAKPYTGLSVYMRVSASEQGNKRLLRAVVIFVLLAAVLLPAFCLYCRWRRKLKGKEKMKTNQDMLLFDVNMSITTRANEFCKGDRAKRGRSKESWLPLFSLASVSAATVNFCMRNKLGEGGFGPVYKGELLNGQLVAVKRLGSQSGQGLEEFKTEMMLIAKLQHRNLVRILGCCIEQSETILIYEYMPNKSLDFFLFDPTKKGLLSWEARVRIIEGIAQGLLYLHQYSRLRIIHRDLKASNILLDNNMNPKISDFGMARMFGGDELQANTNRIVGTYGYMSPEYALEGIFSIKSDVFSFGILLLETLSSKKNTGFYNTDSLNLLGLAWDLWNEDRAEDLMDPILENEASYPVLKRYINVALLCVQENAEDRPTTSEIVSMLTNELVNLRPPKQPAFSRLRSVKNSVLSTTRLPEACSGNNVTISVIDPR